MIQKDFLKEIIRQQEINLHAKEEGMTETASVLYLILITMH